MKFRAFVEKDSLCFFVESFKNETKQQILRSKFFQAILANGGKPHFVGGAIRDSYLNKESKDIDIVISNIRSEKLADILRSFGELNEVGKSFGILKFQPYEFEVNEPIDIAVPRTERPMTQEEKENYKKEKGKHPSAYQAFTAVPDHTLSVHKDLSRRDFTINAIAQDHLGNIIDPYDGINDIKNKIIRMVDKKAFSQDPLRMLRGVQFASRFNFEIEPETFKEIKGNASLIKGIPGERILIELDKIVQKGNQYKGAELLCETGLWQEISGLACSDHDSEMFSKSKKMSEFLFLMMRKQTEDKAMQVCRKLKCDIPTEKQLKGLYFAWNKKDTNPDVVVFELNKIHPSCLNLHILPKEIIESIASDVPKSINDLKINGDDLMKMGYKGQQIGNALRDIIMQVLNNKLQNDRQDIIKYIQNKS